MQLVLIDLFPALLSWEGRGAPGPPEVRPGAPELLDDLYSDFSLAGLADGDHSAGEVRRALEDLDLDLFFDDLGTTSVFGPTVTPRVVRKIARALGAEGRTIAVTARPRLADALYRAGIPVVLVDGPLDEVGEAVRRMASGRVNP